MRQVLRGGQALMIAVLCLVGGGLSGCRTPPPKEIVIEGTPDKPEAILAPVKVERGIASYYYGRWIGRKTASGEIYRASDLTAAHRTLPFNTMVRVTNLRNNLSVVVRINNRGPYVRGRIIDLSIAAAQAIRMTDAGIVPVTVEVLKPADIVVRPNLRRPAQAESTPPSQDEHAAAHARKNRRGITAKLPSSSARDAQKPQTSEKKEPSRPAQQPRADKEKTEKKPTPAHRKPARAAPRR